MGNKICFGNKGKNGRNKEAPKRWIQELHQYPDHYTVHDLYGLYPDEKIDIEKEQQLIENQDQIIFQFPFYWFNCSPLLKKWLDEVLTHGWAFGSKGGYQLANKKLPLLFLQVLTKKIIPKTVNINTH